VPKQATSSWGRKRAGAGRPRLKLADLIESQTFDPGRLSHQRALDADELPDRIPRVGEDDLELLRELQKRYRASIGFGYGGPAVALARTWSHTLEHARFGDEAA
jgi:hypothetical protein